MEETSDWAEARLIGGPESWGSYSCEKREKSPACPSSPWSCFVSEMQPAKTKFRLVTDSLSGGMKSVKL